MKYNPEKYNRQSIRLEGYDYSRPGDYFVTICTKDGKNMFGEVVGGEMVLDEVGKIAEKCWLEIPEHFSDVELDISQIMPNHIHVILRIIADLVGAENFAPTGKGK